MSDRCLKCDKKTVRWWKNLFSNYYDYKCGSCGYVWHELEPGSPRARADRPRSSVVGRQSSVKPPRSRGPSRAKTRAAAKRRKGAE